MAILLRRTLLLLALLIATDLSAAELRFGGAEVAAIVQRTFAGTVIHLDRDLPPAPGKAAAPGSFIRLGPQLGGTKYLFSMPQHEIDLPLGSTARFVVTDVNSNPAFMVATPQGPRPFGENIKVVAMPQFYIVTLRFEEAGREIHGFSDGRFASAVVPDVEIRDIRVQVTLIPRNLPGGRVGFAPSQVWFYGDVQAQGVADVRLFGRTYDVLDAMTDYKREIKSSIEKQVASLVDRNLNAIAGQLWSETVKRGRAMGVNVTGARFAGTDLVIAGNVVQ